jgi:hypothetical protein
LQEDKEGRIVTGLRTVAEIAIGVLFAAGAVFNTVYTRSHSDEFYGSFADGAWLSPARSFINNVVLPNATVFTAALIVFQVLVAIAILNRGDLVAAGLYAGAAFAAVAALASNPGGTAGNLALAVIQLALALSR